ncbi:MAG: histone deacetylase family protein [Proteobacteria bacterium]|nr:histone deacetylase family protein [Pseudomonadota bacterium]
MKVVYHPDYCQVYTSDPASAAGRIEAVVEVIGSRVDWVRPRLAAPEDIAAVHTENHVAAICRQGLYDIAALAAGGAVMAAEIGLDEPCFGLIRPPGHHASAGSAWGFCFFSNMAIALEALIRRGRIETACVLDIDLHYGDGTVNILGRRPGVEIHNFDARDRRSYLDDVRRTMERCRADLIGISAGFDNHEQDWGGVLGTEDYREIGRLARESSVGRGGGCFAILEGGYNHHVLGHNVMALIEGLEGN